MRRMMSVFFGVSELKTDVTHPGRGRFQTAPYIGLIGSRATRPRRRQEARDLSGNRAENQPPATYCVTSVKNKGSFGNNVKETVRLISKIDHF